MTFLYAATGPFDAEHPSWQGYAEWSGLTHLSEVVSLDCSLNENLVEPDYDNADDWNYIHTVEHEHSDLYDSLQTGFYTSLDYVLNRVNTTVEFNLLTVVIEPDQECSVIEREGYEFIGYDLLDKDFSISALTNCGGFDETFLPSDQNDKGLIDELEKAYDIKRRLLENNPDETHADTNVIAIWRHKTLGRGKSTVEAHQSA